MIPVGMGVNIALAVAKTFCIPAGVPKVIGNFGIFPFHFLECVKKSQGGVGLWSCCQTETGFGKGKVPLGKTYAVKGLGAGNNGGYGSGVG